MASVTFFKKVTILAPIFALILIAAPLRFQSLGYSDYIGDERKAFIQPDPGQSLYNFFITRRKGPMQFLVSEIPHLIVGNFRNELAQRIPFSVVSLAAVIVFYLLIKKLTGSTGTAFFSSFLYAVNGFIVGFGRIAQYQNLNLLFNFLSLYFYSDLVCKKRHFIRSTLLGTLFFSLSILSHWDAIFIVPIIVFFFIKFLLKNRDRKSYISRILINNFVLGFILLMPFLLPYLFTFMGHSDNQDYFARRIEIGFHDLDFYLLLFKLYNPFLMLEILLVTAIFGLISSKKSYIFGLWFIFAFVSITLLMRKPGTHIYNFLLPVIVLSGMGINWIFRFFPGWLKLIPGTAITVVFAFLLYQSYYIYVEHSVEYPWSKKVYFSDIKAISPGRSIVDRLPELVTPDYGIEQKLPLFGFPHYRHWDEVNSYINEQNLKSNERYGYITNEDKTISEWYMDTKYRADNGFYIVGIKNPVNFVLDSDFPQFSGKTEVIRFYNEDEWVTKIYKVPPKIK